MPSQFRPIRQPFYLSVVFGVPRAAKRRTASRFLTLSSVVVSCVCAGCGVVGSAPAAPVTITVMPTSAEPFPGEAVQFTASVQNAPTSSITWQVNQIPGGSPAVGTISSAGVYTAPAVVPTPAAVTVTASLPSAPTVTATAVVTIQNLSAVQGPLSISPRLASVTESQTVQLNILTAGINNTEVNWAVDGIPNGNLTVGTISLSGVYSPSGASGPHLITAALKANLGVIGSATVEVSGFPGTWTWRNDNARSGVNDQELALAPTTVNASTFGKLFSCPLDGNAYAQPLYVPNVSTPGNVPQNIIFVATENDSVYAFNADAKPCVQLWHTRLVPTGSQAVATPDINVIFPTVGITGTPVIDLRTSTLYAVAETQTIGVSGSSSQRLYALDLATGTPKIQAAGVQIISPVTQAFAFFPANQLQRAALLLDNGNVYVAFGSFGEQGDYNGWLFAYDSGTLNLTGAFDVTPGNFQGRGGIWQSGGGPSADTNHNIFLATGDGAFNAGLQEANHEFSNSFLRLANAGGISVADYFTPCDESSGQILGTTTTVLLPDSAGSALQPHLMIGGSKSGSLYVINRDSMGGYVGPCPDSVARVQTFGAGGALLSTPLFWNGSIYVAPENGNLRAFPMSAGLATATPISAQSPEQLGPQGATPVLSSNGTNNGLVWLIDSSGALSTPNTAAILRAYDATNLSNEIYNSAMASASRDAAGLAVKFSVPTVANGKVYVGTQTELDVYGLE